MNISEEMVRELQKRVDVSYEEAEYTLKRTRGDINMALYIIMKRRNSGWERFKASFSDIFSKLIRYRLILTRKGKTLVDLPLILLVVLVLIDGVYRHMFPLFVIFILALVFECEVKIVKSTDEDKAPEKEATTNTVTHTDEEKFETSVVIQPVKATQPIKAQPPVVVEKDENIPTKDPDEDDYFEIVIEE